MFCFINLTWFSLARFCESSALSSLNLRKFSELISAQTWPQNFPPFPKSTNKTPKSTLISPNSALNHITNSIAQPPKPKIHKIYCPIIKVESLWSAASPSEIVNLVWILLNFLDLDFYQFRRLRLCRPRMIIEISLSYGNKAKHVMPMSRHRRPSRHRPSRSIPCEIMMQLTDQIREERQHRP